MINPASRALAVLRELKITSLKNVDIEDIYTLKGIHYSEELLVGSQARIVSTQNFSKITLNSTLTYKNQKRFAQAHELGHYELHRGTKIICDNEKSFVEYHKNGGQEMEANEFASELLMPRKPFQQHATNKPFSVDLIHEMSEHFETSITSTSIRYADIGHERIAIVFSQDGKVKWIKVNNRLPLQFINVGLPVPEYSVVANYYRSGSVPKTSMALDPFIWFFSDYNVNDFKQEKIYEQVFPIGSINSAISFLWFK